MGARRARSGATVALAPAEVVAAADIAVVAEGAERAQRGGGAVQVEAARAGMTVRLGERAERQGQSQSDRERPNGPSPSLYFQAAIARFAGTATLARVLPTRRVATGG